MVAQPPPTSVSIHDVPGPQPITHFFPRLAGCQGYDIQMAPKKGLEVQKREQQILKQGPVQIAGNVSWNLRQEKQRTTGEVANCIRKGLKVSL